MNEFESEKYYLEPYKQKTWLMHIQLTPTVVANNVPTRQDWVAYHKLSFIFFFTFQSKNHDRPHVNR